MAVVFLGRNNRKPYHAGSVKYGSSKGVTRGHSGTTCFMIRRQDVDAAGGKVGSLIGLLKFKILYYRKNSLNPVSKIGLGYGARGARVIMPRDRVTGGDAEMKNPHRLYQMKHESVH